MPATTWKDTYLFDVYEFAREGLSQQRIAEAIGVPWDTFDGWYRKKVLLREAYKRGVAVRDRPAQQLVYVYGHLPPDLREVWDTLVNIGDRRDAADEVDKLLGPLGEKGKQLLLLHTLATNHWNLSTALYRLRLEVARFRKWCHEDEDFAALIREVEWHKDNYYESALLGRVAAGDPNAILHVARTRLRGRGYGDKVEVEVSGHVTHEVTVATPVDLDALALPVELRRQLLDHMARQYPALGCGPPREEHLPDGPAGAVDAVPHRVLRDEEDGQ